MPGLLPYDCFTLPSLSFPLRKAFPGDSTEKEGSIPTMLRVNIVNIALCIKDTKIEGAGEENGRRGGTGN